MSRDSSPDRARDASARDKLTPVMRQWDDAKRAHPDAVLFFRLGDFYEMFHDDAVHVVHLHHLLSRADDPYLLLSRSKRDLHIARTVGAQE